VLLGVRGRTVDASEGQRVGVHLVVRVVAPVAAGLGGPRRRGRAVADAGARGVSTCEAGSRRDGCSGGRACG
jgi:hypothetical protein